jgi:hypothetical protein
MRRYKPTVLPEYGPYTCWRESDGLHFIYNSGWSECTHKIGRWSVRKFLRTIEIPLSADLHALLRGFTYEEWKNLHIAFHDFEGDASGPISRDETEKSDQ